MRRPSLFLLTAAAVAIGGTMLGASACGSSTGGGGSGGGAGGDVPAGCFDYGSFEAESPKVGFKADVLPLFRRSCGLSGSCHNSEDSNNGGQHFYGLAQSAGEMTPAQIQKIFDQSVGKDAVAEPAMKVITAGDPEHSFLMYKLDGDPMAPEKQLTCATLKCTAENTCGTSMPQGGPQLPEAERDTIRRWIAQGAKND